MGEMKLPDVAAVSGEKGCGRFGGGGYRPFCGIFVQLDGSPSHIHAQLDHAPLFGKSNQ
jgi:hypothetical protein